MEQGIGGGQLHVQKMAGQVSSTGPCFVKTKRQRANQIPFHFDLLSNRDIGWYIEESVDVAESEGEVAAVPCAALVDDRFAEVVHELSVEVEIDVPQLLDVCLEKLGRDNVL